MNDYYISGNLLHAIHGPTNLTSATILLNRFYYYCSFTHEDAEAREFVCFACSVAELEILAIWFRHPNSFSFKFFCLQYFIMLAIHLPRFIFFHKSQISYTTLYRMTRNAISSFDMKQYQFSYVNSRNKFYCVAFWIEQSTETELNNAALT